MGYRCRDCGLITTQKKSVNKCPQCGSLYLLPDNLKLGISHRRVRISIAERFFNLFAGIVCGMLTLCIWTLVIIFKGGGDLLFWALPDNLHLAWQVSLAVGIIVGVSGFIFGQERMVKILGILWGSDTKFNQTLHTWNIELPHWLVWLIIFSLLLFLYVYYRV